MRLIATNRTINDMTDFEVRALLGDIILTALIVQDAVELGQQTHEILIDSDVLIDVSDDKGFNLTMHKLMNGGNHV